MEMQVSFNDGLGFDPESLFITLDPDCTYDVGDLEKTFVDIEKFKTKDLIFDGNLIGNQHFLKWLTALLIAEEYYITLVVDLRELNEFGMNLTVFAQRNVIVVTELFRKWSEILDTIDKGDILLVRHEDINTLRRVTRQVIDRKNGVYIYFDEKMLDRELVLGSELAGIFPYKGI
jgi:hypothetical protein